MVCLGYIIVNRLHKGDNKYDDDDDDGNDNNNNLKFLFLVSYLNQRNDSLQ